MKFGKEIVWNSIMVSSIIWKSHYFTYSYKLEPSTSNCLSKFSFYPYVAFIINIIICLKIEVNSILAFKVCSQHTIPSWKLQEFCAFSWCPSLFIWAGWSTRTRQPSLTFGLSVSFSLSTYVFIRHLGLLLLFDEIHHVLFKEKII